MATAKTNIPTIQDFNGLTGQVTLRELTTEEIADREATAAEVMAKQLEREAKATARASALAKLAELGLTQEEIAAL